MVPGFSLSFEINRGFFGKKSFPPLKNGRKHDILTHNRNFAPVKINAGVEILKVLLTGITGLVGASVVTAILREHDDIDIVAICRPGKGITAESRVVKVIHDQCAFDGVPEAAEKCLKHITIISGDIKNFPKEEIIAKGPYDVFFHCAADVNLGKDPDGKVRQTNLEGTRNALELAHLLKVKYLHYVSTAYVAGT